MGSFVLLPVFCYRGMPLLVKPYAAAVMSCLLVCCLKNGAQEVSLINALVQFQGPLVKVHIHVHVYSMVINSRRFCVKGLDYIPCSHVPVHSTYRPSFRNLPKGGQNEYL